MLGILYITYMQSEEESVFLKVFQIFCYVVKTVHNIIIMLQLIH